MRNTFVKTITKLAIENDKVMLLMGDTGAGLFNELSAQSPKQFINMGIAEANMVTVAAGLANSGFIPFVYAIGSHVVYRAFEQIRNDVCLNNTNVKIVSVGSGLHYADHGPTHHTTEDIAVLKSLPNLTIFSPSGASDTEMLTLKAVEMIGPVYIRLGRGKDTSYNLTSGNDVTVITTGASVSDVCEVANSLAKEGIGVRVINIHTLKPIDKETIVKAARKTKKIITVEEHQLIGGLGETIASVLLENDCNVKFRRIGIDDVFCSYNGSYEGIKDEYGISKNFIKNAVKEMK